MIANQNGVGMEEKMELTLNADIPPASNKIAAGIAMPNPITNGQNPLLFILMPPVKLEKVKRMQKRLLLLLLKVHNLLECQNLQQSIKLFPIIDHTM